MTGRWRNRRKPPFEPPRTLGIICAIVLTAWVMVEVSNRIWPVLPN
jgi:hypothetical protein